MIVIRAELWKGGDPDHREHLGTVVIANVGGTATSGDYAFDIFRRGPWALWKSGVVSGFKRKQYQVWYLLYDILREAFGDKLEKAFDVRREGTPTSRHRIAYTGRLVRALAGRRVSDSEGDVACGVDCKAGASHLFPRTHEICPIKPGDRLTVEVGPSTPLTIEYDIVTGQVTASTSTIPWTFRVVDEDVTIVTENRESISGPNLGATR